MSKISNKIDISFCAVSDFKFSILMSCDIMPYVCVN